MGELPLSRSGLSLPAVLIVLASFLVSACGSATTPSDNVTIVLDRSIAGVSLGESRSGAERTLGSGFRVSERIEGTGSEPRTRIETRFYKGLNITYVESVHSSAHGREHVGILDTEDARYRTPSGLGVGSPWQDVLALQHTSSSLGSCSTIAHQCQHGGSWATGGRLTVFFRGSGDRVTRVVMMFGH
jgi:hypothetical protein